LRKICPKATPTWPKSGACGLACPKPSRPGSWRWSGRPSLQKPPGSTSEGERGQARCRRGAAAVLGRLAAIRAGIVARVKTCGAGDLGEKRWTGQYTHSVDAKRGQMKCLTQKKQGRFAFVCTSTRTAAGAGRGRFGATSNSCAWPTPGDTTRGGRHGHAEPLNARTPCPAPVRPTPGRIDLAAGCAAGLTRRFGNATRRRQRTSPAACARPGA